ncbi:methionine ABC transporter ATP-binding protein [uncultured Cloacibacillus sp.]|uniref:methionine ABC transporter ATP-binding protein n=1 Tax=uncultured Cloacibacillus sp. TaxID=889794 RepID=UPI0026DD7A14|nr:ATP-binding cassette domain-containing protein [uncultured Cloacibacillus sp.]
MIKIESLYKDYDGTPILDNISLDIGCGDVFGLVGLSGAGKSTLLRCIIGQEDFSRGTITINGMNVKEYAGKNNSPLRKHTGMIFQQFSLLNRMTVYENVALPMKCWKYPRKEIHKRVYDLLKLVGLSERADAKPRQLSGGQKQRVAIARALTMQPDVLFCDEATSALDPITTDSMLALLRDINRSLGVTIVVVTHEMSVIKSICNKIAILSHGKICEVGNTDDIFLKGTSDLRTVLGEHVNGTNDILAGDIKLIFRNESQNKELLFSIAKSLGIPYTVVWSSFDTYCGEIKGYYIIRVKPSDRSALFSYLEKNNIEFVEVSPNE